MLRTADSSERAGDWRNEISVSVVRKCLAGRVDCLRQGVPARAALRMPRRVSLFPHPPAIDRRHTHCDVMNHARESHSAVGADSHIRPPSTDDTPTVVQAGRLNSVSRRRLSPVQC